MKKFAIAIAAVAALSAGTAGAVEVGVVGDYDYAKHAKTGYGITVGEHFGPAGIEAGWIRNSDIKLNTYTAIGSYDVTKFGSATVAVKGGVAYIDQEAGKTWSANRNGWATVVGAGISVPVDKKVSLAVDYRYQKGQDKVDALDGSKVMIGAKYAF
mgnify:CR=1 FL=1